MNVRFCEQKNIPFELASKSPSVLFILTFYFPVLSWLFRIAVHAFGRFIRHLQSEHVFAKVLHVSPFFFAGNARAIVHDRDRNEKNSTHTCICLRMYQKSVCECQRIYLFLFSEWFFRKPRSAKKGTHYWPGKFALPFCEEKLLNLRTTLVSA